MRTAQQELERILQSDEQTNILIDSSQQHSEEAYKRVLLYLALRGFVRNAQAKDIIQQIHQLKSIDRECFNGVLTVSYQAEKKALESAMEQARKEWEEQMSPASPIELLNAVNRVTEKLCEDILLIDIPQYRTYVLANAAALHTPSINPGSQSTSSGHKGSDGPRKPRVIIIGSGVSGVTAAKKLLKLKPAFEVVIIDKKAAFECHMSFTNFAASSAELSTKNLFASKALKDAIVIKGEVAKITPESVVLKEEFSDGRLFGNRIPYDFLLVGSGSTGQEPSYQVSGHPMIVQPYNADSLHQYRNIITKVRSIAIIGGGPVGVEIAGELASNYPDKEVHLISRSPLLLGRMCHDSITAHNRVVEAFTKFKNLKLYLGEEVTWINSTNVYVGTRIIAANIVFSCIGYMPQTEFFHPHMSHALAEGGYVRVNKHLQVVGGNLTSESSDALQYIDPQLEDEHDLQHSDVPAPGTSTSTQVSNDGATASSSSVSVAAANGSSNHHEAPALAGNHSATTYWNVFAMGDIAAIQEEKLAAVAKKHAKIVVQNVEAIAKMMYKQQIQFPTHRLLNDQNTLNANSSSEMVNAMASIMQQQRALIGASVSKVQGLVEYKATRKFTIITLGPKMAMSLYGDKVMMTSSLMRSMKRFMEKKLMQNVA